MISVPIVVAVTGGIAVLLALFGGGIKVKEVELPPLPGWVRIIAGLVGFVLILLAALPPVLPPQPPPPPPPAPNARIMEPQHESGGRVPTDVRTEVYYNNIPQGRYFWVVVRVPKLRPVWLVYPQLRNGIPTGITGDGTYITTVSIGSDADFDEPFNVVVLLLDEEANSSFTTYSKNCIDTGICPGTLLPATGVDILDFTTVIRE